MPAPYSMDLRQRVVEAYTSGDGIQVEVGERFQVGEATVRRWVAKWRKVGSVAPVTPASTRPERRALDGSGEAKLVALVEANPDASGDELVLEMAEQHAIFVSRSTVMRTLRRLQITRKKRRS